MKKKLIIFFILSICVLTVCSCARSISQAELLGKYDLKEKFVREVLVLEPNGEFFQEVKVEVDGEKRSASTTGTWKLSVENNRITLTNHLFVIDGHGKLRKNFDKPIDGLASFPVSRTLFGKIKIESGEGVYYRKIKNDNP